MTTFTLENSAWLSDSSTCVAWNPSKFINSWVRHAMMALWTWKMCVRGYDSSKKAECLVKTNRRSQRHALFFKFILIKNSTCFGQAYCPSSGVLMLYSQQLVFVIVVMLPSADESWQYWPRSFKWVCIRPLSFPSHLTTSSMSSNSRLRNFADDTAS